MPRRRGLATRRTLFRLAGAAAWAFVLALGGGAEAVAARSLVVYCSHDPDACELAAQTFTRETGIAVAITRKPTGEFYAQLRAERENPKADVWYGGTFDPFLQGAAEGLFAEHRSPGLAELHPWARRQAEATGYRVGGDLPDHHRLRHQPGGARETQPRRAACWSDLVKPEYRREIELSNAVTSGTGYTILATLVALYGEDAAFAYLKRLDPNVVRYTQSGIAQGPSVARGEVGDRRDLRPRVRHPAARRLPRGHRDSLRRHRRRAGRHGDRRRRSQSGGGARVLRLGAHPQARRSSPTARATCCCPLTGPRRSGPRPPATPTSRWSTSIRRSSARPRSASGCLRDGRRKSATPCAEKV